MRRILISEDARWELIAAAANAAPFETGGVLLGVRAGRDSWVTTVAHLPPEEPTPARYVLPKGATGPAVDVARARDPRVGYLGEWHSHPTGGGPSSSDRAVMQTLAWYLPFPQPLLIVVAAELDGYVLRGYTSRLFFLLPTEVVTTGPLPRRA